MQVFFTLRKDSQPLRLATPAINPTCPQSRRPLLLSFVVPLPLRFVVFLRPRRSGRGGAGAACAVNTKPCPYGNQAATPSCRSLRELRFRPVSRRNPSRAAPVRLRSADDGSSLPDGRGPELEGVLQTPPMRPCLIVLHMTRRSRGPWAWVAGSQDTYLCLSVPYSLEGSKHRATTVVGADRRCVSTHVPQRTRYAHSQRDSDSSTRPRWNRPPMLCPWRAAHGHMRRDGKNYVKIERRPE